jgi:hypothetical protein
MDFLEIALSWALALNYLRERAEERKNRPDAPRRLSLLHLTMQIVGRVLMIIGVHLHLAGKQLVTLGQQSTS